MAKLEIEVQPEEEVRLQNLARDQGLTLDDYLRQALLSAGDAANSSHTSDKEPIWKKAIALGLSIPAEDRLAVPLDGARNYKKYLYGDNGASE
jgi:hypothetical protein